MLLGLYLMGTVIASYVLLKSVEVFINSTKKIAHYFKISGYTISFLLVAVGTSLPEIVVGVTSAIEGNPILSFGNAIGSNIALLTLVIALPILIGGTISTRTILRSNDIYFSVIFAVVPLLLVVDGVLSRTDGLIMLLAYAVYFGTVMRRAKGLEAFMERFEHINIWKEFVLFAISLVFLIGSSEVVVRAAISISEILGLSLGFIGLTLTAVGTSLPEIAFVLGATGRRQDQTILGNIIGSVVANSSIVLGSTAVVSPIILINGNTLTGLSSIISLVLVLLVFLAFSRSKQNLGRSEAVFLLLMYALFVGFEYYLL